MHKPEIVGHGADVAAKAKPGYKIILVQCHEKEVDETKAAIAQLGTK